ncbi:Uncharacterised protein [Candidatus Anstonella stagnisolia]|nr:Uncharacterised protein [Candidatus Anstonella stagnisolia]
MAQETVRLDILAATTQKRAKNNLALNYGPMDESLRLPENKENLGIELKDHNQFGSAIVKIKNFEEGKATSANQAIFLKNADGSYSIDLKGIEGLGFLFCIEDENGALYKPAAEKDGKLVYLGISNILITQELLGWMKQNNLHFTIVVDAYAPGNLQSDKSALVMRGGTLALPDLSSAKPAPDHNSDEAVKKLYSKLILVRASSIATISNVTNAYLLQISNAAKNIYLSAVRASQNLPYLFNLRPAFSLLWFARSSELELTRRQRVLEQSAQRRVQKMLLFDAAAPTTYGAGATENFQPDFTQLPNAPMFPASGMGGSPGFDGGDYFGGSGGERMRGGTREGSKAQQGNPNSVSNPANARAWDSVSNPTSSTLKNSTPTKAANNENTRGKAAITNGSRVKAANVQNAVEAAAPLSNFQTQAPISEGKTQVQNSQAVQVPVQNMQNVSTAQKSQSRASNAQTQVVQGSIQQAAQHEVQAQPQTAKTQSLQEQQESMQTIVQAEEVQQPAVQQEHVPTATHQEHAVQAIMQEPQLQFRPIAVQRIRTQKKKAGEKILPRIPISVCANADNGKNKKENPMNANKKETALNANSEEKEDSARVAQTVKPVPRRVIPGGIVAFLPLRNLFENSKGKKEEKHACPSKVCGWCGRKAA